VKVAAALTAAVVAWIASAAFAAPAGTVSLLRVFSPEIATIKKHSRLPVILPALLPLSSAMTKVFASGGPGRRGWSLELDAAPSCRGANACFLAGFDAVRGGTIPGRANLRLASGDPARFHPVSCGASCSPATLWFTHGGVLYLWQAKDVASKRSVLIGLANAAIKAGPR
jgi:hypothetical protein